MIEIGKLESKDVGRRVKWRERYEREGELRAWDSRLLLVVEAYSKDRRTVHVDPLQAEFVDDKETANVS